MDNPRFGVTNFFVLAALFQRPGCTMAISCANVLPVTVCFSFHRISRMLWGIVTLIVQDRAWERCDQSDEKVKHNTKALKLRTKPKPVDRPSLEPWQDKLGPAVVWAAGFVSESFGKRLLNLINPMHESLSKSGKSSSMSDHSNNNQVVHRNHASLDPTQ